MIAASRPALTLVLLGSFACTLPGCIGFSGPSDIARRIETDRPVDLTKEMGVNVGPVGVFLASAVAGVAGMPVNLDGLSSVDFGEYSVEPLSSDPRASCLRHLEVPGWEPVVRVCEPDTDILVMVNEGDKVRGILVVQRDGRDLHVVRAKGNFDKLMTNLLESDLVGDAIGEWDGWLDAEVTISTTEEDRVPAQTGE